MIALGLSPFVLIALVVFILASLRQINEYERGILFTMGRFSNVLTPGWRIVLPIFQSMQKVDVRTKVVEEPD